MSVSERLKVLCDLEGSIANFSKKTGIKAQTIGRIINEGTGIRSNTVDFISQAYPNLNIHWLMTGSGEMWLDKNSNDQTQQEIAQLMAENSKLKEEVLRLMEDRKLDKDQIKKLWDLVEEYRGKR